MKKTVYFSENIFDTEKDLDTIASRVISALEYYDFASEDIDEVRADVRRMEEGSSGPILPPHLQHHYCPTRRNNN